jgi:SpoIID/LytB domain protein
MRCAPARRRVSAVASVLVVLGATVAAAVAATRPALAETYFPSASQDFPLSGHGFGHGRGLSQWGAYGMATEGHSAQEVLDFYFPSSQTTDLGANPPVRVWLKQDEGIDVNIVANLGAQTVTDVTANNQIALPPTVDGAPVTNWRAARDTPTSPTLLWGAWAGAWHPYPTTGQLTSTGIVRFASDTGVIRLVYPNSTQRDYQGTMDAVPDGPTLRSVDTVPMEDYLKGVVPHESINSWPAAALQAQAIAARTYAAARLNAGAVYDICDDKLCQVYTGVASYDANGTQTAALQFPESNAAIAAVADLIRSVNGSPISVGYSSSNGGWSVDGGVPWQPAQPDPWDHYAPDHNWSAVLTNAAIQTAYPSVGTVTSLVINQRDGNGEWGGRVQSLTLNGTTGSVTVTGTDFRTAMGLKSTWWTVGSQSFAQPGYLHPLTPARILDTRIAGGRFAQAETRAVQVGGAGGVPADAVGAVLTVTATDTTTHSYLTVWPRPFNRPTTSNLNWDKGGQTVANLVYTRLGPDGTVLIYNNLGNASVVVDVFGYYAPPEIPGGLGFAPVTPNRILDTRDAAFGPPHPLAAAETRNIAVGGTPGIRADAQSVLVNLTGTRPTADTYLTLWPSGLDRPGTSNLNVLPGDTRANAALGSLGGGALSLYNNRGRTDAIVDVLGQYLPGDGTTGQFVGMQPSRLLDTRTANGGHPAAFNPAETFALRVLGRGGVPTTGVSAVVLTVTAVAPTALTYVTAWASGLGRPPTSNLNAPPGAVVANLVVSAVGGDGAVDLYNNLGRTGVVVDVVGWITG